MTQTQTMQSQPTRAYVTGDFVQFGVVATRQTWQVRRDSGRHGYPEFRPVDGDMGAEVTNAVRSAGLAALHAAERGPVLGVPRETARALRAASRRCGFSVLSL